MKPVTSLFAALIFLAACGTDPPISSNATNNGVIGEGCEVGERSCQDVRTLATCAQSSDGSTRVVTTTCLDSEECRDGDCLDVPRDCEDSCTPPETRCTREGNVESCADHDNDGCNEFGAARSCDGGELCDPADGLCKASACTDQCTEGVTSCEDGLITTCARGVGGCLDWGPAKECPDGQSCSADACVADATCDDECIEDETGCTGEGELITCSRDADADSCTEYGAPQACPGDQTCRDGACVAVDACQDQCLANERVCVGNDIATCETNAEGCLEFSPPSSCPGANESCQSSGGAVSCAAVQMSGKVVINEIFFDPLGDDFRGTTEGSPTFVELYGPPGLSIANFKLELVNGSGGATYGSFSLPGDAQLDGYGFAVITTDYPDTLLGLVLPFFTNVYDVMTGSTGNQDVLQNGPDNARLLDANGTTIDAVAYGEFQASSVFAGEGACASPPAACDSAPDTMGGRSIGRDATGTDTDNNKADFLTYVPTPSLPNSDLIINEMYFDQPGTDDGSQTFVELMAPIHGWEDLLLDGYVLQAINGFNGKDYIFTLDGAGNPVRDGIVMDGWYLNDGNGTDGYVVTCNIDNASPALIDLCTVPFEGVDFQNGPDNFVLTYEGRVIDAVGYGSFTGTSVFVGEGTPATFTSANSGKSLARWPVYDVSRDLDTDDNANDFFRVSPTPGADNPLP